MRRPSVLEKRALKRACLLLWMLPPAWFLARWPDGSVSPAAAVAPQTGVMGAAGISRSPAWHEMKADDAWLARLRGSIHDGALNDEVVVGLMRADMPRGVRIRTLMETFPDSSPAVRAQILDLLATLQPIEATPWLIGLLREARDPTQAAKLLETLRAATLATASGIRPCCDSAESQRAFESIQKVFRDVLKHPDADGLRFRAAVAAVSDVFPRSEAMRIFEDIEHRLKRNPGDIPLSSAELEGAWLESMAGSVDGRDFNGVMAFVRSHPQALSSEQVKARLCGLLSITPVRADEAAAVAPLIESLEPGDAPDDSYVRWLELKSRLTGTVEPIVPASALSPVRKAALIHFGGLDAGMLDRETSGRLRRELIEAAALLPHSEERDFLETAAEKTRPPATGE